MAPQYHLDVVAKLSGMVHGCLKDCISPGEPVAMLDFPNYRNVGDSAIWLGQIAWLSSQFGKFPSYVSALGDHSHDRLDRVMPTGPILITGGGTFGDIWPGHQELRESVLERWPNRLVVQLPQSIHYRSQESLERMARAVARHKNFVLLVRDQESKQFAEKHFDCLIRLCPDMAFCMGPLQPSAPVKFPVLAMLRNDQERASSYDLSAYTDVRVEDWITETRAPLRIAKTLAVAQAAVTLNPERVKLAAFNAAAGTRLRRGIRQLSRGRAIVTDRLHVHICSLLLGRPHAVLDNNYGKVRRFMRSFSGGTELSYLATGLDDAISWARKQAHETPSDAVGPNLRKLPDEG